MKDKNKTKAQLITELAEMRLRVSELEQLNTGQMYTDEKFRAIFESAPVAHYLYDLKGKFIDGNKAAERITGYRKEELIGENLLKINILPKNQLPRIAVTLAKNVLGKPTGPDEFTLNRKDGSKIDVEILTHPIKLEGKALVLGTARDITERVQAEETLRKRAEELRKSQALYRQAERMGKMGYWGWDYQKNMMDSCSQQFARIFEMSEDEALDFFSDSRLLHPDDLERFDQHLLTTRKQRKGMDIEYRVILRSGAVRHIHIQSELVLDEQGEIIRSFGTVQDITERVQAEEHAKQQATETAVLFSVSQMLAQAPPDSDEIALVIARQFVDVIGFPEVSVALYDPQDDTLRYLIDCFDKKDVGPNDENWTGKVIAMSDYPNVVCVKETLEPLVAQASDSDLDTDMLAYMEDGGVKTIAFFPMVVKGGFIGFIELETWFEEYHYTPRELDLAMALANQAAVALESARSYERAQREITERKWTEMELHRANKQLQTHLADIKELQVALREQATRDPLTGLFNRRHMEDALKRELARASRKGEPLSVVILDLDRLKEINDIYGHVTGGDKALQILADTLKQMCRDEDTLCRYAGDEFLVILYDTPTQVAYERASQWREAVGKIKVTSDERKFGITFSAGVAAFPDHGSTGDGILQNADRALYRAKELGRDQVVVYQQGSSK